MPLDGPCQIPRTASQKRHKRFAAPYRTLLSLSPAETRSGYCRLPWFGYQFPPHEVCTTILPAGWLHLRQPIQRTCPCTQAHQNAELLHVGEGFAHGMETTIEAGTFDFRLCCPLEAALVVIALEFELSDKHYPPTSNPARWPRSIPTTAMLLAGFSASLRTKLFHRLRCGHARNSTTGLSRFFGN